MKRRRSRVGHFNRFESVTFSASSPDWASDCGVENLGKIALGMRSGW